MFSVSQNLEYLGLQCFKSAITYAICSLPQQKLSGHSKHFELNDKSHCSRTITDVILKLVIIDTADKYIMEPFYCHLARYCIEILLIFIHIKINLAQEPAITKLQSMKIATIKQISQRIKSKNTQSIFPLKQSLEEKKLQIMN